MTPLRRPLDGDRGSIAPLVPVVALVVLLLGGLVIDASRQLNARGRAVAFAEEAARAGAGAVRLGEAVLALDEDQAAFRVDRFCQALLDDPAQSGGVTRCEFVGLEAVSDDDPRLIAVRVRVELDLPATLLGIVGVRRLPASGEGRARPFEGVDPLDVDSSPPPVEVPEPLDPPSAPPDSEIPAPDPGPPGPSPAPSPGPSAPAPDPSAPAPPAPAPEPSPEPSPASP